MKHHYGKISTVQKFIDKAFWQAEDNRWMMGEYAYISFSVPLSPYSLMTTTKPGSGHWAHMSAVATYPVPIGHLLCPLRGLTAGFLWEYFWVKWPVQTWESVSIDRPRPIAHPLCQLRCIDPQTLGDLNWSQLVQIGVATESSAQALIKLSKTKAIRETQWISNVDLPGGFQPLCCPARQGSTTPTNVPHRS